MRALVCAFLLFAQQSEPTTTAIVGARIVLDPTTTIDNGTIVLRDGLPRIGLHEPILCLRTDEDRAALTQALAARGLARHETDRS